MLEEAIAVVKQEFESVPDNEGLIRKVTDKLCQTYENPPVKDFEVVIQKPFTADEVRKALFAPLEDQISYYSSLLSASVEAPIAHPLTKTGSLLLTLIYLIHRKKYSFLKEFVLSDGLLSITRLMRHENLYERSQALEIFMSITDCDVYDWFAPPDGYSDRMMHHKLLALSNEPHFLNNLLYNRIDSYPGGSFRALQILAFWLSWVRALYTKDQTLHLSTKLADSLHQWSLQLPNPESGVMEEEVQLAKTLYDDFCKDSSTLDSANNVCISGVVMPTSVNENNIKSDSAIQILQRSAVSATVSTSHASQDVVSVDKIVSMKDSGNALYRNNDAEAAFKKYKEALVLLQSLFRRLEEESSINNAETVNNLQLLEVALRTNCSNALWKMYNMTKSMDNPANTDKDSLLDEIISHCEAALQLQPTHAKACYRLLLTMIERKQHRAAYDRAETFKKLLLAECANTPTENSGTLGHQLTDDIDRISYLQRRCTAAEILRYHNTNGNKDISYPSPAFNCADWGLDTKRLKLLSTILKRDHLSDVISDYLLQENVSEVKSTEKENRSSATVAAKKAKDEIIKADPKIDKILNYLFEQRDEMVDHGIATKVSKSDGKSNSKSTEKSKKFSSDKKNSDKQKITSKDRQAVQTLKQMAGTFSSLTLRAKSYSKEDPTIVTEKSSILQSATELLESLLITKQLSLKDLFLTLDDNDILFLVSLIAFLLSSNEKHDLGLCVIKGIVKVDRVQSLFFLFRLEYSQLREELQEIVQTFIQNNPDPENEKQLLSFIKLLSD